MEKVVHIIKLPIPPELRDVHYWLKQPPLARIAAVEEIRREYHGWKPGAEPRMHKVCRIVPLSAKSSDVTTEYTKIHENDSEADTSTR